MTRSACCMALPSEALEVSPEGSKGVISRYCVDRPKLPFNDIRRFKPPKRWRSRPSGESHEALTSGDVFEPGLFPGDDSGFKNPVMLRNTLRIGLSRAVESGLRSICISASTSRASGRRQGSWSQALSMSLANVWFLILAIGGRRLWRSASIETVCPGRFLKGTSPESMDHTTIAPEYTSILTSYCSFRSTSGAMNLNEPVVPVIGRLHDSPSFALDCFLQSPKSIRTMVVWSSCSTMLFGFTSRCTRSEMYKHQYATDRRSKNRL